MSTTRTALACAALALFACSDRSKAAPSCAVVGTKFVVLARADLETATLEADTRRLVVDQLPAMRDSLVRACTDGKWSSAIRACMVDAIDHDTFEKCERDLTPAQRNTLERGDSDER